MSVTKRAKTLDQEEFNKLLRHVEDNSPTPERDKLMMLLSFKAGLRAAEIAKIDLSAMLDASGRVAKYITVYGNVGKMGKERQIPMHEEIKDAVRRFRKRYPKATGVAVSVLDESRMSVNAVTLYIHRLFKRVGFSGCSSHSGRRTFGTELAQRANRFHQSIKDVQLLMGHARLDTTERYIQPSGDTSALVNSL